MRVFSLNTIALALIVFSLTVPTGAVLGDHVGGPEGVVLNPHSGPNGQYASIDGNGNLSIDLGDDLNDDAVTTYDGVFDVTNNASHYAQVWITHNATQYVEFRESGSRSIEGVGNGTVLAPGETLVVDVTVDTHGASPGTQVIQEMEVHARHVDPPTPASGSGGSSGPSTPPTGTPREPTGSLVGSGVVRIQFDQELRPDEEVRVERLDGLPPDPPEGGLTARASRADAGSRKASAPPASEERLRELDIDTAVAPDEAFVLSGAESVFPSVASVSRNQRAAVVYDITPPQRLRDGAATIWLTVNRTQLGGADPSEARLVRRTAEGWQVLGTEATPVNATHVEVRSRTPGFSAFALFPRTDVAFDWTFDDGRAASGVDVPLTYQEPGIYAGTLVVTDAYGRSDDERFRLLVNDRPRVRIERPETIQPGQSVTLRADVTDEFGDTRVTWEFDDGTVARGTTVTRTFDDGEHTVSVRAVDEFGAETTVEEQFVVGQQDTIVRVVEFALGVEGRLALIALASLVVVGITRRIVGRLGRNGRRRRR